MLRHDPAFTSGVVMFTVRLLPAEEVVMPFPVTEKLSSANVTVPAPPVCASVCVRV